MRNLLAGMLMVSLGMSITGLALPLYASDLGASYTEIGLLGAAYVVFNVIFSPIAGRLADRHGRKTPLVLGLFLVSFSFVLYPAVKAVWWLLVVRLLQGAAEAPVWINAQASAADCSKVGCMGRAMGIYGVSWAVGVAVGPLVGAYLYKSIGINWTFLLGAATALAATLIVLATSLPKPKIMPKRVKFGELASPCILGFVYVGVVAVIFTIFPVYIYQIGISAAGVGLMITLFATIRALFFIPLGNVSDRYGSRPVIQLGLFCLVIGSAGLVVAQGYFLLALMISILAIAEGALYPAVMSVVSKIGGQTSAYVLGIFNAVAVLGWGVLPPISGYLADHVDLLAPYLICAVIAFVALAFLWKLMPKK